MLFWIDASDVAIQVVCWVGAALSVLLFLNRLPRLCLLLLYVLYLSLLYGGQDFMTFQWDTFLLETGFLGAAHELRRDAGHLAAALAPVPLPVHVGHGQATER